MYNYWEGGMVERKWENTFPALPNWPTLSTPLPLYIFSGIPRFCSSCYQRWCLQSQQMNMANSWGNVNSLVSLVKSVVGLVESV